MGGLLVKCFMGLHSDSIHARSIFPCQDTPAARIRYSALLNVPRELCAVMFARHVDRRSPVAGEGHSHCCVVGLTRCGVPKRGEVGPMTRVYSEAVNSVLDEESGAVDGGEREV
ncbi:hypothetical protein GOBAR_DD17969 [Gossypium barbadense]|nr:hypothetical protein GOBAR_DD17969 [Gossypium barbadense]